jgi:DNA-binding NarL/FixJ family response regulator
MLGRMRLSVLVVDDDPMFRGVARRILSAGGLDVVGEACTAEAATIVALELRPDALLVDVGLPDGDGVVLALQLAALPWRRPGGRGPQRGRGVPAQTGPS